MIAEKIIDLETCSACCLACNFCPRSSIKRNDHRIDFKHVSRLNVGPKHIVWLSGLGEPLLTCPDLEVRIVKQKGAKVYSNSNAAFDMFPRNLDRCMKMGLSFVNVSVYGWDQASYKETTNSDSFEIVLKNVKHLKSTGLAMRLSYVQTKSSPKDVKKRIVEAFDVTKVRLLNEHGRALEGQSCEPPKRCSLCANYLFVSSDGIALPCVNDVRIVHPLGTDYDKVYGLKKLGYPWDICRKCDCGARFASDKEGFMEKISRLDAGVTK